MLALMQAHREQAWFSLRHSGGELPFGSENWFIAGIDFGPGLQITYHLPARLWAVAQDTGAAMLDCGRQWDGHTSTDQWLLWGTSPGLQAGFSSAGS
jgi:hypothetical protein